MSGSTRSETYEPPNIPVHRLWTGTPTKMSSPKHKSVLDHVQPAIRTPRAPLTVGGSVFAAIASALASPSGMCSQFAYYQRGPIREQNERTKAATSENMAFCSCRGS